MTVAAKREPDPGTVKQELIETCTRGGALVAGVAEAAAFSEAPEGYRPADLLPGARSVLVIGGSPPRAGEWISPKRELMETVSTADRITVLGLRIAQVIEARYGYYALCLPPGTDKGNQPFMSMALAAELAGCGSRSLAGPILHPVHGMLYYSAILTTLPLPPDGRLQPPPCPAPECATRWEEAGTCPCLEVCPIDADGCLGGRLDDGRWSDRRYDLERCTTRVYQYWIPGYQVALAAALDEDDRERRKAILYGSFFTRTLWSITYSNVTQGQCFECMRVCPVGKDARTLR